MLVRGDLLPFRRAEAPGRGGAVALEAGFVFQVFAFVSRRSGLFCLTQLSLAPARAPLQDGLAVGCHLHPIRLTFLAQDETTGSVS